MPVKRITDLPAVEIPEPNRRFLRTIYSPEQDPDLVGDLTLFHCRICPHTNSDFHSHDRSGEIMYVVSGGGEGQLGEEVFPLWSESAFYAPPGVPHQVRNTGDEDIVLLTLFSPAVGTAYAVAKAAEDR